MPGGFGHALGGAARRRAQENVVIVLQQGQNAADDGGFAGAGAAGNDQHAFLHGAADGPALRFRERDAGFLFVFGNPAVQALHPLIGPGVHQPGQPQRDFAFRQIIKGQAKGVFAIGNGKAHHHFFQQRMGNLRVHQLFRRMQHGCGPAEQHFPGKIGMPRPVGRLAEQIKQRGADAELALGIHAHAEGDTVGGQKAHAVDIHHHAIGIFTNQLYGIFPVIFADPHSQIGADAVILQEHQHPAHAHLLGVAFQNHGGFFLADTADLGQAFGMLVQNFQRVFPEMPHDQLGRRRADAPDQAGAQILFNGGFPGRRRNGAFQCMKLLAVGGVFRPAALEGHVFAGA